MVRSPGDDSAAAPMASSAPTAASPATGATGATGASGAPPPRAPRSLRLEVDMETYPGGVPAAGQAGAALARHVIEEGQPARRRGRQQQRRARAPLAHV